MKCAVVTIRRSSVRNVCLSSKTVNQAGVRGSKQGDPPGAVAAHARRGDDLRIANVAPERGWLSQWRLL
jgi:hypothetical protein